MTENFSKQLLSIVKRIYYNKTFRTMERKKEFIFSFGNSTYISCNKRTNTKAISRGDT